MSKEFNYYSYYIVIMATYNEKIQDQFLFLLCILPSTQGNGTFWALFSYLLPATLISKADNGMLKKIHIFYVV